MPRERQDRDVARARKLRREMSLPEVLLWRIFRREPEGVKLRRQHPIGKYVIDFHCAKSNIGIEIDGFAHATGDRPLHDEQRDAYLNEQGVQIIRIPASEVLLSPECVAESIVRYCKRG